MKLSAKPPAFQVDKGLTDRQLLKLIEVYCIFEDNLKENANGEFEDNPISTIYRFVHAQLTRYKGGCKNLHHDWREEAIKAYEEFEKMGEL